jgi:nitroimidazol reductase NimA-like FMN-containing flavoprotein (pyridoxamine 5'-phosphate oxidase superfamily)
MMMEEAERLRTSDLQQPAPSRQMIALSREEAIRLLSEVSLGRIVFTQQALPAVRPVNHVVDDGDIVIRTHGSATLASMASPAGAPGVVVAYEADAIDPETHLGWSVVATGYAQLVTDPDLLARYKRVLRPWVDQTMESAVRIRPDLVTGFRLTDPSALADAPDAV